MNRIGKMDVAFMIKEVEKRVKIQKKQNEVTEHIIAVLEKFDGKTVSKRIHTALKNNPFLKDFTIFAEYRYDLFYIEMWGNGVAYNDKISIFVADRNNQVVNPIVDVNKLKNISTTRKENLKKLEGGIKHIPELCKKWNAAIDILQEVNREAEEYNFGYDFHI